MKKTILSFVVGLAAIVSASAQQLTWSTNVPNGTAILVTTNRMNLTKIQIGAGSGGNVVFNVFNSESLADPYFGTNNVIPAYTGKLSYITNVVDTYVGSTGYTNYYTNSYLATVNVSNAQTTNALTAAFTCTVQASAVATFEDPDILLEKGVVIRASTNCSVTLYYNR